MADPVARKLVRREFKSDGKHVAAWFVYCPACERAHRFLVECEEAPGEVWQFDGKTGRPTFSPSLLVESGPMKPGDPNHICHSYLHAGVWQFLSDCTHAMAGEKVPMVAFPENYRV